MRPGDLSGAEPRRTRLLWVWRGFLALALLAAALVCVFAATGQPGAATKWAVVGLLWAAIGWWVRGLARPPRPMG